MKLKIELTASKGVMDAALSELASEDFLNKIVAAAGGELQLMTERNFRSDKDRPIEWDELAEATVTRRANKKKGKKKGTRTGIRPLIDTGTLIRSFSVTDPVSGEAELTSTTEYAVYHQFGTVHMPARPFVPVTGEFGGDATPTENAKKRMIKAMKKAIKAEVPDFVS